MTPFASTTMAVGMYSAFAMVGPVALSSTHASFSTQHAERALGTGNGAHDHCR